MSKDSLSTNYHAEEYLDYYCELQHPPEFAVMLKGQWGSGKTWFMKKYCEKLEKKQKTLYVSLYGMTNFSELEFAFYQQLHPLLSSPGMAIFGKIAKSFLKGALKIDLNNDGKDDGTMSLQTPEINLPEYLKDIDKRILIFDDLERCKIDIVNLLGYINQFVEHRGLKVILIANEEEIQKKDELYKIIKEKLIGKTFDISSDFDNSFECFIEILRDEESKKILSDNIQVIKGIYDKSNCRNLRILRQIILDFERIFKKLPEEVKSNSKAVLELLMQLIVFSIGIKLGQIFPEDILKLPNPYSSRLIAAIPAQDRLNPEREEEGSTPIQDIYNTHNFLRSRYLFPNLEWWKIFFDNGTIDDEKLKISIQNSIHFRDENTPSWIKLYHFYQLKDDEFSNLLKGIEDEYLEKAFPKLEEVIHVFGLLLKFSDKGLYEKTKEDILQKTKLFIRKLKDQKCLEILLFKENSFESYNGLGYSENKSKEFKEFTDYIYEIQKQMIEENMPDLAERLLEIMRTKPSSFKEIVARDRLDLLNELDYETLKYPVLKFIKPTDFLDVLLCLDFQGQSSIFLGISLRYDYTRKLAHMHADMWLVGELQWLTETRNALEAEAKNRKGKVSGYNLDYFCTNYLDKSIADLQGFKT
jgi:hypothetical protein